MGRLKSTFNSKSLLWPYIHSTNMKEKLRSTSRKTCHFIHSIFITTFFGFQANTQFEQWVTTWKLKSSEMLCRFRWTGTHISQGTACSNFRVEKSGLLFYPRPRLEVLTKCLCLFIKPYCVTQHCNLHICCNKNLKSHTNLACTNTVTRLLAGWPP